MFTFSDPKVAGAIDAPCGAGDREPPLPTLRPANEGKGKEAPSHTCPGDGIPHGPVDLSPRSGLYPTEEAKCGEKLQKCPGGCLGDLGPQSGWGGLHSACPGAGGVTEGQTYHCAAPRQPHGTSLQPCTHGGWSFPFLTRPGARQKPAARQPFQARTKPPLCGTCPGGLNWSWVVPHPYSCVRQGTIT